MKKLLSFCLLFLLFGNIRAQQVTLSKSTYALGEPIVANFSGSTSAKDWLAIFPKSAVPASMNNLGWVYTSGNQNASQTVIESGTVTFKSGVITPGDYKVCVLADDGYTPVASAEFTVPNPPLGLVGDWLFDDPNNLVLAKSGNPLELVGTQTAVAGPSATDGAVRIGVGSYYKMVHGIVPNNGNLVNTYSLCYDVMVDTLGRYYSLLQTNTDNNDDAEVFIGKIGNIGVKSTGYSNQNIRPHTWNRIVIVVNNGTEYSVYLNGAKALTGYAQPIDGNFALKPTALLFADNDGEDNDINVAHVSIFNKALTESEVKGLGGFEQALPPICSFETNPYLQNVTPNSATIVWESDYENAGSVNYGTTNAYGSSVTATVTKTSANTYIQKAVIPSLQDGTTYYYRAVSRSCPFQEQSFKAAISDANTPFTVGIWGDNNNSSIFSKMSSYLINNLSPDFCFSTGDLSNNGNSRTDLAKGFIPNVLGTIGSKVPFYESFGNHDVNAQFKDTDLIRKYIVQPSDNNSDASKVSGSYAYAYGNSVFISIDWNKYSADLAPNGWLETFLKSPVSQQAKFRFIFIHCAPFYERSQNLEQEIVKTNIPLLSKKYGITAVFSGHMHGYERGVLDGVQYITQGGCDTMAVNEPVGPVLYPGIIVGTNKANNPANFNNGLSNHLLTLDITPTSATSNLHYFDASGNYLGVIESVEMKPRTPLPDAVNTPTEFGFSILQSSTKGIFKIKAPENFNVNVFDLQGKKVFSKFNMSPDNDLNLSNLNQGVYLLKLGSKQKEYTKTIVIE